MPALPFTSNLLRTDAENPEERVTFFELFFDLVFVFAVTQVSHLILDEPSWTHLVEALVLAVVVWWVWIYTAWVTNWLHPDRGPVRGMLTVLMLLGLLFATAIPDAFGDKAPLFAITLAAMSVGRSAFVIAAFGRRRPEHAINFVRITSWAIVTGALWIVGAYLDEHARLWVWGIAFLIEIAGPRAFFWVPGLGRSRIEAWDVLGEHMSERVSLFLIIALGESVIETGAGFAEHPFTPVSLLAFLAAFAGTVLMWFLYFNHSQSLGSRFIRDAEQTGMVAQTAFTYVPVVLVIGVVLTAVGNGLVLEHPTGGSEPWTAGLLSAGAGVYLLGNALFKRATGGPWLISHLAGAVAFAALYLLHPLMDAVTLSWIGNGVLLVIVVVDELGYRSWKRLQASLGG